MKISEKILRAVSAADIRDGILVVPDDVEILDPEFSSRIWNRDQRIAIREIRFPEGFKILADYSLSDLDTLETVVLPGSINLPC